MGEVPGGTCSPRAQQNDFSSSETCQGLIHIPQVTAWQFLDPGTYCIQVHMDEFVQYTTSNSCKSDPRSSFTCTSPLHPQVGPCSPHFPTCRRTVSILVQCGGWCLGTNIHIILALLHVHQQVDDRLSSNDSGDSGRLPGPARPRELGRPLRIGRSRKRHGLVSSNPFEVQ